MRVLHVNKYLYRRGGAESYLLDLAELQQASGDEVAFFGMHHRDNEPVAYSDWFPDTVELDPAPRSLRDRVGAVGRMVWSTSASRGVHHVAAHVRPDVAHAHNVYHQLSPSVLVSLHRSGVPVVMTVHDYKLVCPTYQLLDHGAACEACLHGDFTQAVRRRCKDGSVAASAALAAETWLHRASGAYGAVDVFICPSRTLADKLREAGVFPDRVRVLDHFVDARRVIPKERPGGPVVYGGRLNSEKGVDVLIRAVGRVPGLRLEVAGEGPERAALEAMAGRLAPGRVTFRGRLGRDALTALLRTALVVALPARWQENQPLIVLEAYAAGVPVVGTSLGSLPEIIVDGTTGRVVAPNDRDALAEALAALHDDPGHAMGLGAAGRRLALERFSPARHLRALRDLYAEATGARPPPSKAPPRAAARCESSER